MRYTPSLAQQRIQTIDIIRGVALFGILLFNIQTYSLFAFLRTEQVYALNLDKPGIYEPVQYTLRVLVRGQFYTIYSFLFGLGFYLMMQKNNHAGLPANKLFRRRLGWLLLIGLIHAFVFWFGDILHIYALLGFTLIYFNKKKVSTLVKWIAFLAAFSIVFQLVKTVFFMPSAESAVKAQEATDKVIMEVVDTWQRGTISEVFNLQKLGVAMLWIRNILSGLSGFVHYEIMFLLGLIAGKMQFFSRITGLLPQLKKWLLILLPAGILLKMYAATDVFHPGDLAISDPYIHLLHVLADFIGVPLLTIAYLLLISIIFHARTGPVSAWLANTGRLGLTNYLGQTFLCMILFYGYAGGLSGKVTLVQSLGLAVLIYAFQVFYSNLWIAHYGMGPMERLWRRLTYGKISVVSL